MNKKEAKKTEEMLDTLAQIHLKQKIVHKVCGPCGISANVLTCLKKFGNRPSKLCFTTSTSHKSTCDVCGIKAMVTSPRDFFYPDFSLLNRTFAYINRKKSPLPSNTEEE